MKFKHESKPFTTMETKVRRDSLSTSSGDTEVTCAKRNPLGDLMPRDIQNVKRCGSL